MEQVKPEMREESQEELVFYTDARASETDAEVGGYLAISHNLKECPWFSVKITKDLAPWMMCRAGNPKRVIAALELLGTIIALKLWGGRTKGSLKAVVRAFTDNRGNSFAVVRGMSTKYPATILLMELSEELRIQDIHMEIEWLKRDFNTKADDLSNGKTDEFEENLREEVTAERMNWRVLTGLQKKAEELYEELQKMKESKRHATLAEGTSRKKRKVLAKW